MKRFLLAALLAIGIAGCATVEQPHRIAQVAGISAADLRAAIAVVEQEQRAAPVVVVSDVEPVEGGLLGQIRNLANSTEWLPYNNAQAPPFDIALSVPIEALLYGTQVQPSFSLDLQTTLVPERNYGSGTPTYTRALAAYQTDHTGKLNLLPAAAARMQGARVEQSVVSTKSEDWTNAAWTKSASMTATATTLTAADANQTVLQTYTAASANYVLRVRMSRITGTGDIDLTLDGGTGWTTVTLTGSPQVFSIAQTGVTNPQFGIRVVTSGDAINADQIAVYSTTGKANVNPPEYVSVGVTAAPYHGLGVDSIKAFGTLNGNTVASNVVTEATGAAINSSEAACAGGVTAGVVDASGPHGYLAEGARTNDILQSNTLGTTWTISHADDMNAVAADAYVSVDGTTTMDKLQPKATTAVHSLDQAFTFTAAKYTTCADLRYVSATPQRWVALILNDGTTTWGASFDLLNGVVGAVSAGATSTIEATALANVYRACTTNTANAAAAAGTVKISLNNSNTATLESAARAGTETLGVGMVQHEVGTFNTSRITTTTVAVARPADVLTYPSAGNISAGAATLYAEYSSPAGSAISNHGVIGLSAGESVSAPNFALLRVKNAGNIDCGGNASAASLGSIAGSFSAPTKIAGTLNASTTSVAVYSQGVASSTEATLDWTGAGTTNINIGNLRSATEFQHAFGTIRKVRIWPRALPVSRMQALTTAMMVDLSDSRYMIAANDDYWRIAANQ